nr:uncharacterized protein LOC117835808 [Setaria viridis]
MATYPGDPRARLELAVCAILATGAIKRKRETLIGKTAVCWLNGNSHDTAPHHVIDTLNEKLHIDRHEIKVVKHFPEQYLIFFANSCAYHRAVHHREVPHRGRVFNFEPWTERRGAAESMLEFHHPQLRHPLHRGPLPCQDRTRTYDLWAWCANPSKIPKKVLLTISDPDGEQDGYKGGYDYKLHIHLDVVEDLSFNDGLGGEGHRKPRHEFLWNYGAPDSLREQCCGQGHDDRHGHDYRPRRDDHGDHDDNFHRGVRRQRGQSSWGRMTRCRGAVEDYYNTNRHRGHSGCNWALSPSPGDGGKEGAGGGGTQRRQASGRHGRRSAPARRSPSPTHLSRFRVRTPLLMTPANHQKRAASWTCLQQRKVGCQYLHQWDWEVLRRNQKRERFRMKATCSHSIHEYGRDRDPGATRESAQE